MIDDLPDEPLDGLVRPHPHLPGVRSAFLPPPGPQSHASFLCALPDGDLLCAWFGGSSEGNPDVSIHLARRPAGSDRWSAPQQVSDDPSRSEQNPVLHHDGEVLRLLYTAQEYGSQDTSVVRSRTSADGGRTWGPVSRLSPREGLFIRQPVVTTAAGTRLLPAFDCRVVPGRVWKGDADVSLVLRSTDDGRTWTEHPVPGSTGCVHMDILDLGEGLLVGLFRSRWADRVYRSESRDDGRTWSAPAPTELPNNNSSIQAVTLASGAIALVHNDVDAATAPPGAVTDDMIKRVAEGAPVELERDAVWGVRRVPLTVSVSEDAGHTWRRACVLEASREDTGGAAAVLYDGTPGDREMSYPTVVRRGDELEIAYTWARRAIRAVTLPVTLLG
ncbi:sialidase family protein [Amycolatopsis solani]|uniref:sialidase family protein n=1 Tax=Amycolatopsis solani TaxID=3028615 RepID=UPI0025B17629|nr:sialidase family protein [Amycolatopsis sp. MEP2-6]